MQFGGFQSRRPPSASLDLAGDAGGSTAGYDDCAVPSCRRATPNYNRLIPISTILDPEPMKHLQKANIGA